MSIEDMHLVVFNSLLFCLGLFVCIRTAWVCYRVVSTACQSVLDVFRCFGGSDTKSMSGFL